MCDPTVQREIRDLVAECAGAEAWWADTFIGLGWGVMEAKVYLETSRRSAGSLLRANVDAALCKEAKNYGAPRGLIGAVAEKNSIDDGKVRHTVRNVLDMQEREAILRETSEVAKVTFEPVAGRCYVDHSVASAVNVVFRRWLMRQVPVGAKVLEVGPKIESVLLGGTDMSCYHGYIPVLGPRDAARHNVTAMVSRMARGVGYFSDIQRAAGSAYMAEPDKYFSRCKIEDDDRPGEYIVANHSSYDIDLDTVPDIMAKHGARVWLGTLTRVKALHSGIESGRGEVKELGVRYVVDKAADVIEFHFKGRSSFSYVHKFSSYVKWEERNEYRWAGRYHDYVYTKLPVSSGSTLVYAVYRTKKTLGMMSEPNYVSSGLKGLVDVTSVRVCSVAGKWKVAPVTFRVERLALDKILEYRRHLGLQGNIAATINYMGSVKVRFFLNGVAVGVQDSLSSELFGAMVVFVEAYVTLTRLGSDLDYAAVSRAYREMAAEKSWAGQIAFWLRSVTESVSKKPVSAYRRWREALEFLLSSSEDFEFSMKPCPEVVKVSDGVSQIFVENRWGGAGCVCRELREVSAAMSDLSVYTEIEAKNIELYALRLREEVKTCRCLDAVKVKADVSEASSVTAVDSDYEDDDDEEFFECEGFDREAAAKEYIGVTRHNKAALDAESVRDAVLLFRKGTPNQVDLSKHATARVSPFCVRVENGRLVEVLGKGDVADVGALVDMQRLVVVPVSRNGKNARKDVKGVNDGWHYTSSALKVYNGEPLASAGEAVLADPSALKLLNGVTVKFVEGPYGCGKTRSLAERIADDHYSGMSVAYLAATSSSKDEMISRLRDKGIDGTGFCATLDSYLMNAVWKRKRLYCDEAPMAHYGELLLCIAKMGATEVVAFGDYNQIPYCSFTAEYATPLSSMESDVKKVATMKVLHRCALDALCTWDDLYGNSLVPCDCCSHVRNEDQTMFVKKISGVSQIPKSKTVRYLVFTQSEKEKLREYMGDGATVEVLRRDRKGGLATVHEDQGGTYDEVALVRLNAFFDKAQSSQSPSIYNRTPYALVATTRHKYKFTYYTISLEEDAVVRAVKRVSSEGKRKLLEREVVKGNPLKNLF